MTTYTITFGEVAENGVGMEKLGERYNRGFLVNELLLARQHFRDNGYQAYYINLNKYCPSVLNPDPAGLLLVKGGATIGGDTHDQLLAEQNMLIYDTTKIMNGRVVNSIARHNLCFSDYDQEADIPNGMGTIVSFRSLPCLNRIRNILPTYLGEMADHLNAEGNKYYDITKCGIGYHGDTERKVIVGLRLGEPMDIAYLWHYLDQPVGSGIKLTLDPGDLYVMSDKAAGSDWKKKLIPTLRHAAGCDKYTKIPIN